MPAPNTPTDIIDRIRALERKIEDLSGRVNIRPALNTIVGGSVTIKQGGSLVVKDHDGTSVLSIGRISPDLNSQPQMATVIRRMDGSLAFAVWTGASTGSQPVRIYDGNSQIVFADDATAGGLAIPWLPMPLPVASPQAGYFSSTAATFTTVARSIAYFHHPRMYIDMAMSFGAATTGRCRILVDSVQVALFSATGNGSYDVPSWAWTGVPQVKVIELQIIRDTGVNSVFAQPRCIYGRQS